MLMKPTETHNVAIPRDAHRALKRLALDRDTTLAAVMREAVEQYLAREVQR